MTLTLALPGVFYTLCLLGGLPLSVRKLRKIERRSKVQRIVRDLNTPIVYSFFTLGQILTYMGHKMIKILPI